MKTTRYTFLLLLFGLLVATSASAQITVYRDSAKFDDAYARLREIDFEDVYSVTVERILFRNPWGLHCFSYEDSTQADSMNNTLWLGQGATLEFPTRTRRVALEGYGNPFNVRITDFNDSSFVVRTDSFPVDISHAAGIRRLQFLGYFLDDRELDVNWNGGLEVVTTYDDGGDTLAHTEFEELPADHYFLLGMAFTMGGVQEGDGEEGGEPVDDGTAVLFGPIEHHGIIVTEPWTGFGGTFLSEFEARVDPDNPIGNLAVELSAEGTIEFPRGTEGALLLLEAVPERDTIWLEVTDYAGAIDTVMEVGYGHPVDTNWMEDQRTTWLELGFGSEAGIQMIRMLGSTYRGSVMVGTVLLAETPQSEIAGISRVVLGLDTAQILADLELVGLRGKLAAAAANLNRNDPNGAIQMLEGFRRDVEELYRNHRLVPEEARLFLEDAAYVIERIGGVAGVELPERSTRVVLHDPLVGRDDVQIRFASPPGTAPVIRIFDLRGVEVRILEPGIAGDGIRQIRWDLRDDAGNLLPAGTYLVALQAAGETATQALHIVR